MKLKKIANKIIKEQLNPEATGSLLPRQFVNCSGWGSDINFAVCADMGVDNISCTPANGVPDYSNQLEMQNEFYQGVGSPAVGDLIRLNYPNGMGTGDYCIRYTGTEIQFPPGAGFGAIQVTAINYFAENLGNTDCSPCNYVQHNCDTCNGCVEDPNGPFSSLAECQAAGCSEDLESFANSIGIASGVSGMTAAEQYCIKCSTNSYSPPMDEKCGCCEKTGGLPPKDPVKDKMADPTRDRMQKLANIKPRK